VSLRYSSLFLVGELILDFGSLLHGRCGAQYGQIRQEEAPIDFLDAACRYHDNCWADNVDEDCICNLKTLEMIHQGLSNGGCTQVVCGLG
jgi:hypothetical protein